MVRGVTEYQMGLILRGRALARPSRRIDARPELAAILRDASLRDALRMRLMDVFFLPVHYRRHRATARREAFG
jgi:hypothetical protein